MAKVTVDLDLDKRAIARLAEESGGAAAQSVANNLARRVRQNIVSSGRVRTGRMVRSVNITQPSPTERRVSVDVPYAMYQEEGIGPVYPVRAKVLRFTAKNGTVVFARRTRGFKGAHFMSKAFESLGQKDIQPRG